MTTTLISVGILIVLFVLYGVLRPSPGCTGHCSGCDGNNSCATNAEEKHV
ncbi:MAG TPA: hypothetical protein VF021_04035 [Longimicrobiales bacterium]